MSYLFLKPYSVSKLYPCPKSVFIGFPFVIEHGNSELGGWLWVQFLGFVGLFGLVWFGFLGTVDLCFVLPNETQAMILET